MTMPEYDVHDPEQNLQNCMQQFVKLYPNRDLPPVVDGERTYLFSFKKPSRIGVFALARYKEKNKLFVIKGRLITNPGDRASADLKYYAVDCEKPISDHPGTKVGTKMATTVIEQYMVMPQLFFEHFDTPSAFIDTLEERLAEELLADGIVLPAAVARTSVNLSDNQI